MNILLTHAYDRDNKGDAAILSVLISQVREVYKEANLKISTMDDLTKYAEFEGVPYVRSFIYLIRFTFQSKILKAIQTIYIILATTLYAVLATKFHLKPTFLLTPDVRSIMKEWEIADLIIPIGGGYLNSKGDFSSSLNLLLLLHPIFIATILHKPVILYSQSIGPFKHNFERWLIKIVLNRVRVIMVREAISYQTLVRIGVKPSLIHQTVDAGFLFKGKQENAISKYLPQDNQSMIVGVTVRDWLNPIKQHLFESELALFLDYLIEKEKCHVIFIPQVASTIHPDDDRKVGARIKSLMTHRIQVSVLTEKFDHYQIKDLYSGLDLLIGMRMHSVIFALTSNVPCLCIEYEPKTTGILRDLKLDQWVIKVEDFTSTKMTDLYLDLVTKKVEYIKTLNAHLPRYIKLAKGMSTQLNLGEVATL
jgi:colanic acid/amylovoran biosynthesis protein